MTVAILKDFFYIKKSIEHLDNEIRCLRESAEPRSPDMSGNPRAPSGANRLDELIPEIVDKERERAALVAEYEEIAAWIKAQRRKDQLVIKYRYELKMTWEQIAKKIGGGATAEGLKHSHIRCLNRE